MSTVHDDPCLNLLLVHCQGEIGSVIMDGAPPIPGESLLEQMDYINAGHDVLRTFVTSEPRAHAAMSVNLLLPARRAEADAGFIVLQADRAHPMSGSNCICVVTALLESGRIPITAPLMRVRLDTPAGLIEATADCRDGRCASVSLDNVAAWVHELDVPIRTSEWGTIRADIAFGGVFYALVDVEQVGLSIRVDDARDLAEAGMRLKDLIADQVQVAHPEIDGLDSIAYVMFRSSEEHHVVRTCTTLKPGRVDRSPCGTGSSANLATLHARGLAQVGDRWTSRSIISGEFRVEILAETQVAGRTAILPRVTGGAWIYGQQQLRLSALDPFPEGFRLSDTWGSHT